jgi:hypothetical protein
MGGMGFGTTASLRIPQISARIGRKKLGSPEDALQDGYKVRRTLSKRLCGYPLRLGSNIVIAAKRCRNDEFA